MQNLELVQPAAHFAEWWHEERRDSEVTLYNPLLPSSVEVLRERLSKASSDFKDFEKADAFFWGIQFESDLLGHITLQNINRMMLTAEIGYGVSKRARGRGIATSAIRLVAENAFAETPLRKLIALVHEENHSSRRALEKAGFKQEGLLREHFLVNGRPADEAIYGLIRKDLGM